MWRYSNWSNKFLKIILLRCFHLRSFIFNISRSVWFNYNNDLYTEHIVVIFNNINQSLQLETNKEFTFNFKPRDWPGYKPLTGYLPIVSIGFVFRGYAYVGHTSSSTGIATVYGWSYNNLSIDGNTKYFMIPIIYAKNEYAPK